MSVTAATVRTLQPAAWRRAGGIVAVAVIVLSVVLHEPVAMLFADATPRWVVFLAIAVPVAGAFALGLSIAYPRVLVDAAGAGAGAGVLRVRGRTVPLTEVVGLRRSVSSGPSAGYLAYWLVPRDGRAIRVLVAGAPVRGLSLEQLGVLRDAVAASAIPAAAHSGSVERAIMSQNFLGDGRRAEVDRERALRELDGLRGVAYSAVPAASVASAAVGETRSDADLADSVSTAEEFLADDRDAGEQLRLASASTRMLRRVALGAFVLVCLAAAGVLIALVVREASGAWVGDISNDALVSTMAALFALAVVAGIVWGLCADVDDARTRTVSHGWLADASHAQRRRGLPTPFHAAWLRAPGGRMTGLALVIAAMAAIFTVIGGPVMLVEGSVPSVYGIIATVVGVALSAAAIWGWVARRRAHARRIEHFLEQAGERVHGVQSSSR